MHGAACLPQLDYCEVQVPHPGPNPAFWHKGQLSGYENYIIRHRKHSVTYRAVLDSSHLPCPVRITSCKKASQKIVVGILQILTTWRGIEFCFCRRLPYLCIIIDKEKYQSRSSKRQYGYDKKRSVRTRKYQGQRQGGFRKQQGGFRKQRGGFTHAREDSGTARRIHQRQKDMAGRCMTARRSGRLYRDGPQPTEQYGRGNRAEKKETSRFQ